MFYFLALFFACSADTIPKININKKPKNVHTKNICVERNEIKRGVIFTEYSSEITPGLNREHVLFYQVLLKDASIIKER